jgi:hypothetical protein
MEGPIPYPESPFPEPQPQPPFPAQGPPLMYPQQAAPSYPGMLPPPVNYPGRPRGRRFGLIALAILAVVVVATVAAVVVVAQRRDSSVGLTDASAKTAIQKYLDALSNGDQETIARNASCGLFDELKDRRSDMALADLASEAFRKQFSSVEVTSIDKIVVGSPSQSQVLFTMRAVPTGREQGNIERQGVAQLLSEGRDVLVCSYLLRVGI